MRRAVVAAFVLAVAVEATGEARASSIWDRAIDPTLADRDYAHRFATEKEHEAEELDREADHAASLSSTMAEEDHRPRVNAMLAREAARAILERFGAATSADLRLRLDLGRILARLQQFPEARDVLLGALDKAPSDPRASSAWFEVAICDAHLGKRDEEARAYESALALADDPDERALLFANLAEARMSLGKLDDARTAAETSLELVPELVLSRWTLAVILDRAGDGFAALEQAKLCIAGDPDFARLHEPGVFFEPGYEVHYYQGLGELAHARALSPKSPDWEFHLFAALHEFTLYATKAAPDDRWRKRAEEHVLLIEQTLNLKSAKASKSK